MSVLFSVSSCGPQILFELVRAGLKGTHAKPTECIDERFPGKSGQFSGLPLRNFSHFVPFDGGREAHLPSKLVWRAAEGREGVVGKLDGDLWHDDSPTRGRF